ncbi:glycosyl transferase family 1 [Arsukibacterium sp. MJ3]|uniref:TIGR04063 family PEP-CTERM/XrtA system glycosyltransferase n=1 Tax=Arsukibacterium sp. MJ3 TaxID=1632859 RepID=UPI0006271380|nr:TIGR04063 family PEP-CTERM/XrtA system glycosyltransferase [Arsukibacterium sp. MJ3]KKO49303.1 glycosyl transferase family 1 [Arsukibacterium sp. MJ3]
MAEQGPLQVLHVFDHSVPLHSGYAFRSLAILQQQQQLNITTRQLTSSKHYLAGPNPEQVAGLTFYRTKPGWLAKLPVLNQLDVMRQLEQQLTSMVKQQRPDIIHAHSPSLNALAAARVAKRFNIPLVYEMRASWEDAAVSHGSCKEGDLRYKIGQWLEKKALRSADYVVTICQGLATQIAQWGVNKARIAIVANAVDISAFSPVTAKDPQLEASLKLQGKTVLGFLGSFYRYEGLHILLDAFAKLLPQHPNLRLLLVGGGLQEAALKAQATALNINSAVIFTGRVEHNTISRYYSLVDMFVYPRQAIRLTEMVTPLKPLEAMAQQGLVVASDIGGHRELIRHNDTGILFEPDNPDQLAVVLAQLLTNRDDWPRIKQNGRNFVAAERTWQHTVAAIMPVYQQVLSAKK